MDAEQVDRIIAALAPLDEVNERLKALPDWQDVFDRDRNHNRRINVALMIAVSVAFAAIVGIMALGYSQDRNRKHDAHEARCAIRAAVVSVMAGADVPDDQQERIVARLDRDIGTADCPRVTVKPR